MLGLHCIYGYGLYTSVLAEVFNILCGKITGVSLFNEENLRDLDFSNYFKLLKWTIPIFLDRR